MTGCEVGVGDAAQPSVDVAAPAATSTAGKTPGTAQLAATARSSGTPLVLSKTTEVPVSASTAVMNSRPSGHALPASPRPIACSQSSSVVVWALRAA